MISAKRAVCLALALFLALLCGCSRKPDGAPSVSSLGSHSLDESEYRFLYATYKAQYLSLPAYAEFDKYPDREYSPGKTNAERLDEVVRDSIRMYLVAETLFDDARMKLSDGDRAALDEYIDGVIAERFDSSREAFEAALAALGATYETYRAMLENGDKTRALYEHYFGSGGARRVTESEMSEYYRKNYVRFAQINVNDRYAYVEEEGAYVQNEDGSYKTRALTAAESAEKARLAAEIDEALAGGESAESLYEKYSENRDYPGGYYFTAATGAAYDSRIVEAAFGLAVGESAKVQTEHGTFWIERLALPERGWALDGNEDFFEGFEDDVKSELFDGILSSHFGEIEENEEALAAIDGRKIEPNYELG